MSDQDRATQRVALVTGSNRGLGFSMVKLLCKQFNGVVYLTSRSDEKGLEAVKELEKLGLKAQYHQLDIESLESINRLVAYLKQTHGGLDVLINNAAVAIVNKDDSIEKQAAYCNSINFLGNWNLCKAIFPILRPNARVVNVSSRLGMLGSLKSKELREKLRSPDLKAEEIAKIMSDYVEACKKSKKPANEGQSGLTASPYGMSKVCFTALTRVQQREFDNETPKRNIIVSAVCPGFCKTEMTRGWGFMTADQGADCPVYLALLDEKFDGPRGAFWAERKECDWENSSITVDFIKKAPFIIKSMISRK